MKQTRVELDPAARRARPARVPQDAKGPPSRLNGFCIATVCRAPHPENASASGRDYRPGTAPASATLASAPHGTGPPPGKGIGPVGEAKPVRLLIDRVSRLFACRLPLS